MWMKILNYNTIVLKLFHYDTPFFGGEGGGET